MSSTPHLSQQHFLSGPMSFHFLSWDVLTCNFSPSVTEFLLQLQSVSFSEENACVPSSKDFTHSEPGGNRDRKRLSPSQEFFDVLSPPLMCHRVLDICAQPNQTKSWKLENNKSMKLFMLVLSLEKIFYQAIHGFIFTFFVFSQNTKVWGHLFFITTCYHILK